MTVAEIEQSGGLCYGGKVSFSDVQKKFRGVVETF